MEARAAVEAAYGGRLARRASLRGYQSYLVLRHLDVFEDARAALVRVHPVEDGAAIVGAVRVRGPLVGRTIVSAVHLCR